MKVFKQINDVCCEDDELIPGITFAKRLNDAFSEPPYWRHSRYFTREKRYIVNKSYLMFAQILNLQLYKYCLQQSSHHYHRRHSQDRPSSHCNYDVKPHRHQAWTESDFPCTDLVCISDGRCHLASKTDLMEWDKDQDHRTLEVLEQLDQLWKTKAINL